MKTYEQVHAGLFYAFGRASEYPCVACGEPALHWAYNHEAREPEELVEPGGCVYSENLNHYAPMCVPCHKALDMGHWSEERRELMRETGRRVHATRTSEDQQAAGRLRGEALSRRLKTDLEFAQKFSSDRRTDALKRRSCSCGFVSNRSNVGKHQKTSSHSGFTDI